ncbi:MAG: sigma-70 family RNA polymerase sigma factor [Lachnospiraceae bacterium]|nr:sigma-70 family RNA polymerase sigma factor [Lachnospiraceae bacterium]
MERDFEELVKTYGKTIYRCAWSYCRSNADAEDITQQVFLYYLQKKPVFHDEQHERAWFLRVTMNLSKNHLNSWWNRHTEGFAEEKPDENSGDRGKRASVGNASPNPGHKDLNRSSGTGSPEEVAEGMELWELVCKLPENYRNVIFLYYMEGYSVKEISRILGQKGATVRTWMARARHMLKKMLEE